MIDSFQVTVDGNSVIVRAEAFTLIFDKEHVGITSYKYETSGVWHEGVESVSTPPTLFGPYFTAQGIPGGAIYPSGGFTLLVPKALPWFVQITQRGYLRNSSIPDCMDYPVLVIWSLWPSGRIVCHIVVRNESSSPMVLTEEAYRLNPVDDPDIHLGRDDPPNLKWFGFYSSNLGGSSGDRSHDCIVAPYQPGLDQYATGGNTNRIFSANAIIAPSMELDRDFMIVLSANGSWGDCSNSGDFQTNGDKLASDYQFPDPLNGASNAGQVITGLRVDDGFDEGQGGYTVRSV